MENGNVWATRYGRTYRIWSGMTSEVVVTQPEDVQTIFKNSDRHIKAINNNSGWLMGELLGQCVGLFSQDEWQKLKSVTEVPFVRSTATRYLELISQHTKRHFEDLNASGRLSKGLLNPINDLRLLPFWIIAQILYGELDEEMRSQLQALIPLRESLFRSTISGGWTRFWWSQYLPLKVTRDLREIKSRWLAFNDAGYRRAILAYPIVKCWAATATGSITLEQISQTIDDVTMGGISWNLLFLSADPPFQSELRQEIITRRRSASPTEWSQYLLNGSTLLAASIQESSRLRPLAAFSVAQAAPTALVVGGFVVPAKTNYVVDSYALNIQSPHWGGDSASYRPGRLLGHKPTERRYNYWRFGFGPRTCMGKHVADLIIRTLLAHLLENYDLNLPKDSGAVWDRNPETWITHPVSDIRCQRLRGSV